MFGSGSTAASTFCKSLSDADAAALQRLFNDHSIRSFSLWRSFIPQSLRVSNWGILIYVSMLEAVVFWGEGVGLVDVAGAESLLEPSCALS